MLPIPRELESDLTRRLFSGKAMLLTGARQVGKTTLVHSLIRNSGHPHLSMTGDDPTDRRLLEQADLGRLRALIGTNRIWFIDEAQRIPGIGLTAKLITDHLPQVQLILTGSSSFELGGTLGEPLTGRKWVHTLFPISWSEFESHVGLRQAEQDLEERLVFGFYPDVVTAGERRRETLNLLADSYLYQDVLQYGGIRKPDSVRHLVETLAHQVGQEVSTRELGTHIGLDGKTVAHYLDVLEKAFVIIRLPALSRNPRNEVVSTRKVYFWDNGVRNAVIGATQPIPSRSDVGVLWENFLVSERMKRLRYGNRSVHSHFWRTRSQAEVDYVEVESGTVRGFEFKWNPRAAVRTPSSFRDTYAAEVQGINRSGFRDFLL